jgi:hypothetical protein
MSVFAGPKEEPDLGYRRNVVIAREPVAPELTIEQHLDNQLAVMRAQLEGFELVTRGTVELAGRPAPLLEIRSVGPGGRLFSALLAYHLEGGYAWNLSGSHFAGPMFEEARPELLRIMGSLVLEEAR